MQKQTLILVDPGLLQGFIRWAILTLLILVTIFLIAKSKKLQRHWPGILALIVTIIAAPFLILDLVTIKTEKPEPTTPSGHTEPIKPQPTPGKPIQPIEPEAEPEAEPEGNNNSTPSREASNIAPSSSDSDNTPKPLAPKYNLAIEDATITYGDPSGEYKEGETIEITADKKVGYHFDHWESNYSNIDESKTNPIRFTAPNSSISAKPIYAPNTDTAYTVKHAALDLDGGGYTVIETENKTGTTGSTVTPATNDYYGLVAPEAKDVTIAADGNTEVLYVYTRKYFTVTFNANGGEAVESVSAPYESTLDTIPETTRYHADFLGWFTEEDGGERLTTSISIDGDTTYYAHWNLDPFPTKWSQLGACEFNGYGNNITGSECTDYHNVDFIDTGIALYNEENYSKDYEVIFNIDSYDPNGQSTFNIDNTETYADGYQATFFNDKLSSKSERGALGIVVRKSADRITIKSNESESGNGPDLTVSSEPGTIKLARINGVIYYSDHGGDYIKLHELRDPTKTFPITAWFGAYPLNAEGTEHKRVPVATMSNMSIKLGRFFTEDYYTVKYIYNNGTGTTRTALVEKNTTLTPIVATDNNYAFDGWYTAPEGGEKVDDTTVINTDATFYAHWKNTIKAATISPENVTVRVNGETATITVTGDNIEDYTFSAGNSRITVDENGVVTAISCSYPSSNSSVRITGAVSGKYITVPVTVKPKFMTITFDANGGDQVESVLVENGGNLSELPDATREGYVFDGWFTKASGGTQISTPIKITSDKTYHAHWTKAITDDIVNPDSIDIRTDETKQITVNGASLEAYHYATTNSSVATVNASGIVTPTGTGNAVIKVIGERSENVVEIPITVKPKLVTLKFDAQNGETADESQVEQGTVINSLPAPTKENHLFDGWFTTATGGDRINAPITVNANVTYYAHWSKDISLAAISASSISVEVDGQEQITVTGDNIEPFTFTSNNSDIATVDNNGNVKGKAIGETTITIRGTRSNKTKTVSVAVSAKIITVTFDNESNTSTKTIAEGSSFAQTDIPTPEARDKYYFAGWFTSGNVELTTATIIDSSTNYFYARWIKTVENATIAPESLTLAVGETGQIILGNTGDTEAYEFFSSDEGIATIASDGTITAIAGGSTTVGIRGKLSDKTNTITVSVPVIRTITFYPQNGGEAIQVIKADGATVTADDFQKPKNNGYNLIGWFTDATDGEKVELPLAVSGNATYYAHWAITVCRAVVEEELHQETCANGAPCTQSGSHGGPSYSNGSIITYGTVSDGATKKPGDAYDCDLDNDGKFEGGSERFYYLGENEGKSIFIYSENYGGSTDYYTSNLDLLPTSGQWTNPRLTIFSDGKVGRHATLAEINFACGKETSGTQGKWSLYTCNYLLEASKFATNASTLKTAYWLKKEGSTYYRVVTNTDSQVGTKAEKSNNGNRPVIEVNNDNVDIEPYIYESSSVVVEHSVTSDAVEAYFNNIQTWSQGTEDELRTALQTNFNSHHCSITTNKPDVSDAYTFTYEDGTITCDASVPYVAPINSALNVYLADENTLAKGDQVAYTKSDAGYIYNMVPGQTYRWEKADDSSIYGYVKAAAAGNRRFITAGPTRNIRDLGGIQTTDGKTLKYGRLMRGENFDNKTDTVNDLKNLGFLYEYDLREPSSTNPSGSRLPNFVNDQVIHYDFAYHTGDENSATSNYSRTRKAVSDIMSEVVAGNNVYFHCSAGADRAGTTAYLLEGLLGVSEEQRDIDYELTTFSGRSDRNRYYEEKTSGNSTNTKKYKHMKTYMSTNEQIRTWFLAGSQDEDADIALINQFKAAMLTD